MTIYRKKGLIEATRWTPGMELSGVTGLDQGPPVDGDWIAHDPKNPKDKWLIRGEYFANNYEQVT